jgi:two-component system KDP operon response regulator KdpE
MSNPVAVLIEDEVQIRRFVRAALEKEGWQVFEAASLRDGLSESATRKPDLLIVDLGLPDGDGVTLIQDVRSWSGVPIVVLSARHDETEKVRALDAGADDYLSKPFGVGELLARVRANLRRHRAAMPTQGHQGRMVSATSFRFGSVAVDRQSRVVKRDGVEIHLTPIEYRLLLVLIANAGRVMTHLQLLRAVWGPAQADQNHYLRIYMGQKLEIDPSQPQFLLTETAVGYRLHVDD